MTGDWADTPGHIPQADPLSDVPPVFAATRIKRPCGVDPQDDPFRSLRVGERSHAVRLTARLAHILAPWHGTLTWISAARTYSGFGGGEQSA